MPVLFYQIDAFTASPFSGNPAAVCLLDAPANPGWMQKVAAEMNLAETAFLLRERNHRYNLRWFTPAVEVDLCGHATLASAHALWEEEGLDRTADIVFSTKSGELTACRDSDRIRLDFPAAPATECDAPEELLSALGCDASFVGRNQFDWLVVVGSDRIVRRLSPDMRRLRELGGRGVIVTAASDAGDYDFTSRFFAPAAGIDEDPVTGSAHCCLGPYWSRLFGRTDLVGYQASDRGGEVGVGIRGERVELSGRAVTVVRGEILR